MDQRRLALVVPAGAGQRRMQVHLAPGLQHVAEHVVMAVGMQDQGVPAAAVLDPVLAGPGVDPIAGASDPDRVVAGPGRDGVAAAERHHAFLAAGHGHDIASSAKEQHVVAGGRGDRDVAIQHHGAGVALRDRHVRSRSRHRGGRGGRCRRWGWGWGWRGAPHADLQRPGNLSTPAWFQTSTEMASWPAAEPA